MWWISILIVSPIWGMVSAQLFLQAGLGIITTIAGIIGFITGRVERKLTALMIGGGLALFILWSILLYFGFWKLSDILYADEYMYPFGYSTTENIVYWIFVVISVLYLLPQLPGRIKKSWRNATIAGSWKADIINQRSHQR